MAFGVAKTVRMPKSVSGTLVQLTATVMIHFCSRSWLNPKFALGTAEASSNEVGSIAAAAFKKEAVELSETSFLGAADPAEKDDRAQQEAEIILAAFESISRSVLALCRAVCATVTHHPSSHPPSTATLQVGPCYHHAYRIHLLQLIPHE